MVPDWMNAMSFQTLDHAVAGHLLTRLREKDTPSPEFRTLAHRLASILIVEATRTLQTEAKEITTPLEPMQGTQLTAALVLVPILRAGLGMVPAAQEILPEASIGYIGLARDEATAEAKLYYCNLPDLTGKTVLLLDPMLATGGSAASAATHVYAAGAARIIMVAIVAAPEGVAHLQQVHPQIEIISASLDRELNSKKYIMPGLGDFGDRLFGT